MIVEFIGAPGSGKTSLVSTALDALRACGIEAYSVVGASRPFTARTAAGRLVPAWTPKRLRNALLWQLFLLMSAAGRWRSRSDEAALSDFVRMTQQRRPSAAESERRRVVPWLWRLRGVHRFLRRYGRQGEGIVFDQGHAHRVVQLFASDVEAPDPSAVATYLSLVPQPDLLIHVDAPPGVCERRMIERGMLAHFRDKDQDQISAFVGHAHELVTHAVEEARELGWPVATIDNSRNGIAAAQGELRRAIAEFASARPPGAGARNPDGVVR
jgi:thymidylate kinase